MKRNCILLLSSVDRGETQQKHEGPHDGKLKVKVDDLPCADGEDEVKRDAHGGVEAWRGGEGQECGGVIHARAISLLTSHHNRSCCGVPPLENRVEVALRLAAAVVAFVAVNRGQIFRLLGSGGVGGGCGASSGVSSGVGVTVSVSPLCECGCEPGGESGGEVG